MIYGVCVLDKETEALSSFQMADNPNNLLKLLGDSPYYRYARHLLSVPGTLTIPATFCMYDGPTTAAFLMVMPAITWSGDDPATMIGYTASMLEKLELPPTEFFPN